MRITAGPLLTCAAFAVAHVGVWGDAPPHKQGANVFASHLHRLPPLQQNHLDAGAGQLQRCKQPGRTAAHHHHCLLRRAAAPGAGPLGRLRLLLLCAGLLRLAFKRARPFLQPPHACRPECRRVHI